MNSWAKRVLMVSLLMSASALQAGQSKAQVLPPQTAAEKHLQSACLRRSGTYIGDPFKYPLQVGVVPGGDTLGVMVDPEKWAATPESKRFTMMRDVACWYAGGRMLKSVWYTFSVYEPDTNRVLETFSGDNLWPKSGHYQ